MGDIVRVKVTTHRKTGLLVAVSDDLRGLFVHGRTEDELDQRIPEAIRSILEAQGACVADVTPVEVPGSSFMPPIKEYATELCEA